MPVHFWDSSVESTPTAEARRTFKLRAVRFLPRGVAGVAALELSAEPGTAALATATLEPVFPCVATPVLLATLAPAATEVLGSGGRGEVVFGICGPIFGTCEAEASALTPERIADVPPAVVAAADAATATFRIRILIEVTRK